MQASGRAADAARAELERSIAVLAREMPAGHPKLARLEACRGQRRASLPAH
jgi:hypothetical protein